MRSNKFMLAVFVLISSVLAAPVNRRSAVRQTVARRSVQAVLSRASPAGRQSDKPIPRVYRRMISAQDDPLAAVGPSHPALPDGAPSTQPSEPPPPELLPSKVPQDEVLTATLPDASAFPASTATPTSTYSDDPPASTPNTQVPPPETNSGDPIPQRGPHSNSPNPAGNQTQTAEGVSQPEVSSPIVGEKVQEVPPPDPVNTPSAVEDVPTPISPIQAPFTAPNSKAVPSSTAKKAVEGPSISQTSTSSVGEPTFTTTPISAADVPIPHGTEGTWGGTLANSTSGGHSALAGAREGAEHKPMTLGGVLHSLFFDLVYGRFLF